MDALNKIDEGELRSYPLIFTNMIISTITVQARISNLRFMEESLIDFLECTGNITRIDCNFGHKTGPNYIPKPKNKTNRGRKRQPKKVTNRKRQGDGSNFDSMIQFHVLGTHDRPVPTLERRQRVSTPLPEVGGVKWERVTKTYLMKLFRNGKIIVPGVLCEDMSDIREPLQTLADYISDLLPAPESAPIGLVTHFPIMRNYKLELLHCHDTTLPLRIDLNRLLTYGNRHFYTLLNTNVSDITELLVGPRFEGRISPQEHGWKEFARSWNGYRVPQVDTKSSLNWLQSRMGNKNLYVNVKRMTEILQRNSFRDMYEHFVIYVRESRWSLPDHALQQILFYMMHDELKGLYGELKGHDDNKLSYIRYDPQRYNGFLIKIKTPAPAKPDKKTTIKIFNSGLINIDGANNRHEAELIYLWLNKLFVQNPDLLYRKGAQENVEPDAEFPDEVPDVEPVDTRMVPIEEEEDDVEDPYWQEDDVDYDDDETEQTASTISGISREQSTSSIGDIEGLTG